MFCVLGPHKKEDIILKINEKLNENDLSSLNNTPHEDYEQVYKLTALRNYNNKNIQIIHLMLDYTSIFSNN